MLMLNNNLVKLLLRAEAHCTWWFPKALGCQSGSHMLPTMAIDNNNNEEEEKEEDDDKDKEEEDKGLLTI